LPSLLYPDKLGSLQSFPGTIAGSMGWVPGEEERGQEKGGGEKSDKVGCSRMAANQKIRKRDEIRWNS